MSFKFHQSIANGACAKNQLWCAVGNLLMPDNSIGAVTSAIGVVVDEHDPAALRCAAGEIQADMQAPCQARRLGPFQRQRQ